MSDSFSDYHPIDEPPYWPILSFQSEAYTGAVMWTGPWPPPQRMAVALGKTSSQIAHFDADAPDLAGKLEACFSVGLIPLIFVRTNYSKLPSNVDTQHMRRGALYELQDK